MNTIFAIALRELRTLFYSPLAWAILAVVEFLLAYLFLSHIDYFRLIQMKISAIPGAPGVTDLVVAPVFGNAGTLLLLITPLVTMRLIAEERRNQTISLLFSSPIRLSEIILGKYLGVMVFFVILELIILLMPLSLLTGTDLDLGKLFACTLALTLLISGFCAIGLFMSTLTSQPTVAAISSFGVLMLLWVLDWISRTTGGASELFQYLSMLKHFENMLRGLVNSSDIAYFVIISALFIYLSIRRLDYDRRYV